MPKKSNVPASGVICFDGENPKYVLLVLSKGGRFSFPKGRCNLDESLNEAAFRELEEETSLVKEHINILCERVSGVDRLVRVNESTKKGWVGTYLVALLKARKENVRLKQQNKREILYVGWYSIRDAAVALKRSRQKALREALEKCKKQKLSRHPRWVAAELLSLVAPTSRL